MHLSPPYVVELPHVTLALIAQGTPGATLCQEQYHPELQEVPQLGAIAHSLKECKV